MRQYFAQAMLPNHPLMDEMCSELGNDSYRFMVILTELWKEIGEFELTPKILKQRCGVNAQKADRILERFSDYFKKSLRILKIVEDSLENLEKVQESSTLYTQNQHGSTRDLRADKNRKEENKENKVQNLPEEFEQALNLAMNIASNSAANQNTAWVRDFLVVSFTTMKPDNLTHREVLDCWSEACEYWDKRESYIKATFKNKMSEYHSRPKQQKVVDIQTPVKSRLKLDDELADKMLKAPRWQNRFNDTDILPTSDMYKSGLGTVSHNRYGILDLMDWIPLYEEMASNG